MMQVGVVVVYCPVDRTAGHDHKFRIEGVENVEQVAHLIDKARREERIRRGFLNTTTLGADGGVG
jgi:hypothetical protein